MWTKYSSSGFLAQISQLMRSGLMPTTDVWEKTLRNLLNPNIDDLCFLSLSLSLCFCRHSLYSRYTSTLTTHPHTHAHTHTHTHLFHFLHSPLLTLSWLPRTDSVDDSSCQAALSGHCHTIAASISLHCSTPAAWSCPHLLSRLLFSPPKLPPPPPPPLFTSPSGHPANSFGLKSLPQLFLFPPPLLVGGVDGDGSEIIGFPGKLMLWWMICRGSCCARAGSLFCQVSSSLRSVFWCTELQSDNQRPLIDLTLTLIRIKTGM